MLEARELRKSFGGVHALDGCSVTIERGTITGIIGPNGSGKTTLFNVVTGYLPRDGGQVLLNGVASRPDPTRMYAAGLSRTFQHARVFPRLTLLENLAVGARRPLRTLFAVPFDEKTRTKAQALLERFGLTELAHQRAEECSYGQRRLLEFACALMGDPDLVMLDEPTAGVNPVTVQALERHVRELHAAGVTFLIVEHNMDFVMELCDPIIVMNAGTKIAEGSPREIQENELVLEAYLGN